MKNQKKLMLMALALITGVTLSCKKSEPLTETENATGKFKIKNATSTIGHPLGLQTNLRMYGYYAIFGGSWEQQMDSVNIDQLTDVCISFINPNSSGVFTISNDIAQAVIKGHNQNVRMHFSFGGGGGPAYWDNLIKPANRAQVISNIRKVLTDYNFDGVDVDLENERITADYNGFVVQLSDTLRLYNKQLSAALSAYQRNQLSAAVYSRLDFLNVMCYDYGSSPGSHSSFGQFQLDFANFSAKLPASKINMGFPGYAWQYLNGVKNTQVSLKTILQQSPKAYALNYQTPTANKSWWYDGHPVLRQKVAYCLQQGIGGMMMWQIMHDPKSEESSLLKLVNFCAGNPANKGFYPTVPFTLLARHSGKAMEIINASLADVAGVQQGTRDLSANQKWLIEPGGADLKLTNYNSGKVLDARDGTATGLGLQFAQNPWNEGGNQRYRLLPNVLGYYQIVNMTSNRIAGVYQSSTANGMRIVQENNTNGQNQQWMIFREHQQ
ncbi:glycosyl hydrolase family 18 protein [Pedobacter frigoris]|uniref:glycosyl hydrolase family 18 protein n=1 Tax=Pedobacter frigoris TaxID=2571272 RepID=UPI00292D7753|nr:glycosyl hydrolase family 18 protein [Pedobacter frigoris]